MKLIATTAAALALFLGAATQAGAREHHRTTIVVTGHDYYGRPVYSERYLIRVRSCGEPVWGYRPVSRGYREDCRDDYYRGGYDRGHGYDERYYDHRERRGGPPSPVDIHRAHRDAIHRAIGGLFR